MTDNQPGGSPHHTASVPRLRTISVDLSMETRVGDFVQVTARVMNQ